MRLSGSKSSHHDSKSLRVQADCLVEERTQENRLGPAGGQFRVFIFAVSSELRFETKPCARLKSGSGLLKEGGRDSPGVSRWVGGGIQAA